MRQRRDRLVIASVVALTFAVAGVILVTVRRAERDGSSALRDLQLSQVQQLTRSMDSRLKSALTGFQGIVDSPKPWTAKLRDKSDAARIAQLQALNPTARTGFFLVDARQVVTNGTLLRDPKVLGTRVERSGLSGVLAGKPGILPVGDGLTTALPTIDIAYPLKNKAGAVIGAFLFESEVSPDSAFNDEVSQLKRGTSGEFSFLDNEGVVVASSNPGLIGRPLDEPLIAHGVTGFQRGHGRVVVAETVPSTSWRTVFRQDASEFDGALTGPLHSALIYIVLAGILAAITAIVLLGRRLRRAREEQRRLEEISAIREEFISIVSHELRTPVAGLLGFIQTTLDHWDGMTDEERRRALSRSLASARRLQALTRDVLTTSSVEGGATPYAFSVIDLRQEIDSAASAVRDLMPERLIATSVPDNAAWVRVDAERLQQVLTNLLDNAFKSSPPTSPVEVSLAVVGDAVQVSVSDQGPGLSSHEANRVFDKFVRARTATTAGTGLGLYICRQIVEAHGGRIYAKSSGSAGASFVFELPRVAAPADLVGV